MTNIKQDPLSDLLKQHAGDYQVPVTSGSFDRVMQKRDAAHRKKRVALWFSASLVACLVLYTAFYFIPEQTPVAHLQSTTETNPHTPDAPKQQARPHMQTTEVFKNGHSAVIKNSTVYTPIKKPTPLRKASHKHTEDVGATKTQPQNPEQTPIEVFNPVTIVSPDTVKPSISNQQLINKDSLPEDKTIMAVHRTDTFPPGIPSEIVSGKPALWSLSGFFTLLPASNIYSSNSQADLLWLNNQFDSSSRKDRSILAYTTGIKLQRQLTNHFTVYSGMSVSKIIFQEIPGHVVPKSGNKTVNGTASNPDVEFWNKAVAKKTALYRYDQSYTYVEANAGAGYRIEKNKWLFETTAGISLTRLFATRTFFFDSVKVTRFNDAANPRFRKNIVIANLNITAGRQVFKNVYVYAGPVFRFSPVYVYSYKKQPVFMSGLESGIKFLF